MKYTSSGSIVIDKLIVKTIEQQQQKLDEYLEIAKEARELLRHIYDDLKTIEEHNDRGRRRWELIERINSVISRDEEDNNGQ